MPDPDLLEKAMAMKEDLYTLLSIQSTATVDIIKRAYRRTALKYHPDKNPGDPIAAERFHTLTNALAILSDEDARKAYDGLRAAAEKRKEATAAMDEKRRKMKEDLERRESEYKQEVELKRKRENAQAEKVEHLAADGRRMMEELREQRRRKVEQQASMGKSTIPPPTSGPDISDTQTENENSSTMDEMGRTVRVRWALEGPGLSVTKETVELEFARYGKISTVILSESDLRKPSKARLHPSWKHRRPVGKAFVVYKSVVGAANAVESSEKLAKTGQDGDRAPFPEVCWAQGAPPPGLSGHEKEASHHAKASVEGQDGAGNSEASVLERMRKLAEKQQKQQGDGTRPGAGSFSSASANFSAPSGSSFSKPSNAGKGGLSFEEITLIRMRRAGRAQEEERLRREEDDADAAAGTEAGKIYDS